MAAQPIPDAREPAPPSARAEAGRWLDEHGDALYQYALARVGRRELAEDLVQDTFVAALQARERFTGRSTVRTWLVAILRHKIVDHHRRSSGPHRMDLPDPIVDGFFDEAGTWKSAPASWRGPDKALEDSEFREVLDGCLGRLPRALASAFLMREVDGMESDELGRTLGITPGNLRVRLHRARLLLRECLERRWFAVGDRPSGGRE